MKCIELSQGKVTFVDDNDFIWLNQWKWSLSNGYAQRVNKGQHIAMHRLIMEEPKDREIDHINGLRHDNRRVNLRIVTKAQNQQNKPRYYSQKSQYKGVSWHNHFRSTGSGLWRVRVGSTGNRIDIGLFKKERHAAVAYDLWAKDLYGEFARTNFKSM